MPEPIEQDLEQQIQTSASYIFLTLGDDREILYECHNLSRWEARAMLNEALDEFEKGDTDG